MDRFLMELRADRLDGAGIFDTEGYALDQADQRTLAQICCTDTSKGVGTKVYKEEANIIADEPATEAVIPSSGSQVQTEDAQIFYLPKIVNGCPIMLQQADGMWLADNSVLKANTSFVCYRKSKNIDDKLEVGVHMGDKVRGEDDGDWVKAFVVQDDQRTLAQICCTDTPKGVGTKVYKAGANAVINNASVEGKLVFEKEPETLSPDMLSGKVQMTPWSSETLEEWTWKTSVGTGMNEDAEEVLQRRRQRLENRAITLHGPAKDSLCSSGERLAGSTAGYNFAHGNKLPDGTSYSWRHDSAPPKRISKSCTFTATTTGWGHVDGATSW